MENYEEEIVREAASFKDKNKRHVLGAIGFIFGICLAILGIAAGLTYFTLKDAAKDGTVLAQQIQKACKEPGMTDPDLKQFCKGAEEVVEKAPDAVKVNPVPGPPGETGEAGETGPPGPIGDVGPAPSASAVLSAVRRFCVDTNRCEGSDGSDATPAQVAIAVSSYCNSRGQCRGPEGEDGVDGANGVDGKDAEPVTQMQLIQAVDAYCAQSNNCTGPAGENGAPGETGTQGPPGPEGPSGVINVSDICEPAPDRQVINDVITSYDSSTQTVIIDCTYRDLVPGAIP